IKELRESDNVIRINLDSNIDPNEHTIRFYEDSLCEYITMCRFLPQEIYDEIAFIDIHNGENAYNVKIFREGPNAIHGGLYSYDIINKDSILLASKYRPILYFVNGYGDILKELNFYHGEHDITCSLFRSIVNQTISIKHNIIDFPQYVPKWRNHLQPNPKDFKFNDCPLAYTINLSTDEVIKSEVSYPHLYDNDDHIDHNESFSRVFDGENYVYGFFKYDSIIVTPDYKTSKTYSAKSRYLGEIKNPGVPVGREAADLLKLSTHAGYGNLVYDKYRKVFYRFCHFENDYPGPYTPEYYVSYGAFSIMIINSDFRVVGETIFPAKLYAFRVFFVNKDGLWLSENNFQREGVSDDILSFRCLTLEDIRDEK
ncbi:MAG: DUF4221 family protein, partial [Bacteroidales bacterium]|nr:DUF4221 family protein [Bacteroidales bacterium]